MRKRYAFLLSILFVSFPVAVSAQEAQDSGASYRQRESFIKELMIRADWKVAHGDFAGAIEDSELAISKFPGNDPQSRNVKAKAYNVEANAHNRLKQFPAAAEAAGAALVQEPENPAAYENLASAQLHQDSFQLALQATENANRAIYFNQRLGRGSAVAFYLRACADEKLGKLDQRLVDIKAAADIDPRFLDYVRAAAKGAKLCSGGAQEPPVTAESLLSLAQEWLGPLAWPAGGLLALLLAGAGYQVFRRETSDASAAKSLGAKKALQQAPVWVRTGKLLAGKYEFVRVIGKGGMGEVWEARDQSLGRPVAIKRMSAALGALGDQAKEIYLKEAKTLASVHHPNIVDIYEILDMPDGMYLVFELMTGKTVQHLLVENKRLPLGRVKEILRPVCSALEWAHSRGIVHRDLKPSNIMVTDQGYVKVMDFGIARRTEANLARPQTPLPGAEVPAGPRQLHTRTIGGTPAYMAPEAEQGIVSAGSDIYSLGVCLYEMLTDELPFGPAGLGKLEMSFPKASWRAPELRAEVDALIEGALNPKLEARIPSAAEFLSRLEKIPESLPLPKDK